MRFVTDAQRRAIFASYADRIKLFSPLGYREQTPYWMQVLPEPNKLSRFVTYYPGMEIEDADFRPLAEYHAPPISEVLMSDEDRDGISLIYDMNPYGSIAMGTDMPLGSTLTPNVEQLLASGRGLYEDKK